MKSKLYTLGLMLILSALVVTGCGLTAPGVPCPACIYCKELGYTVEDDMCVFPDGSECEHWAFFRGECGPGPLAARDAAVTYVIEHYAEQAPPPGLTWTGEGQRQTFQYTADDWAVTISWTVLLRRGVIRDLLDLLQGHATQRYPVFHQVVVANQTTGFEWVGRVDAAGRVREAPEDHPDYPRAARDAVLAYIVEHYSEQAPALRWPVGLTWMEEFTVERPSHLRNYRYTTVDWVVTISCRTLQAVYQVAVANQATGFRWEGTVDALGRVTEEVAPK